MPTSARTPLRFFGQLADVGIRAPDKTGFCNRLELTNTVAAPLSRSQAEGLPEISRGLRKRSDDTPGHVPNTKRPWRGRTIA